MINNISLRYIFEVFDTIAILGIWDHLTGNFRSVYSVQEGFRVVSLGLYCWVWEVLVRSPLRDVAPELLWGYIGVPYLGARPWRYGPAPVCQNTETEASGKKWGWVAC